MTNFSTEVQINKSDWKIGYNSRMFSIGSCFSERVFDFLSSRKFTISGNPTGINYNPSSIVKSMDYMLGNIVVSEDSIVNSKGVFQHFDFHGSFGSTDFQSLIHKLHQHISKCKTEFENLDVLFITLGTAFVFKHVEKSTVVNNCHKLPNDHFQRLLLKVDEITHELARPLKLVKEKSNNVKVILTVSPIRHIRDGLVENQLSKSSLILACHNLSKNLDFVEYFPSYEIMMDQLRDYRYYADDMIHPTSLATKIIIQKFIDSYLSDDAKITLDQVTKIINGLDHKILHHGTEEHVSFLKNLEKQIVALESKDPDIDLSLEKKEVEFRLKEL